MTDRDPPRLVLVGTARSIPGAAAYARATPDAPQVLGAILIAPGSPVGIRALGVLFELGAIVEQHHPTHAFLCLPESMRPAGIEAECALRRFGIQVRRLPTVEDLLEEETPAAALSATRPVDLATLIDRDPHAIDRDTVRRVLSGRRVLITGAGGSIGSELARVAASFDPALIVLMERSENALFEIDRQLQRRFPHVARRALLHDVTDAGATRRRVLELRPDVIFHAAAHKHVPLMEEHPADAVRNNVLGTRSIADAAILGGAERFVLISSDKAVNPTSVMGATKRLAELYVQGLRQRDRRGRAAQTHLSMVRFGNVLGSAGSVIPIWSAQLGEGGPLTVTDRRMTRYFMTIPEAASLVIQAAAFDPATNSAPVYVLDMGQPIRVLDLAERFVRAHGLLPWIAEPGQSGRIETAAPSHPVIEIVFSGIRPGEKLHEQLAYDAESLLPTPHPGIMAWAEDAERVVDPEALVGQLNAAIATGSHGAILETIRRLVPEMGGARVPLAKAS
ncbi:MAG: polysaccharide biosynthesis protein [Phycisphaeraceae bacterium]|nr:polysaccharide biosynthesis protein [Phycisphaeraceae bacterium]